MEARCAACASPLCDRYSSECNVCVLCILRACSRLSPEHGSRCGTARSGNLSSAQQGKCSSCSCRRDASRLLLHRYSPCVALLVVLLCRVTTHGHRPGCCSICLFLRPLLQKHHWCATGSRIHIVLWKNCACTFRCIRSLLLCCHCH